MESAEKREGGKHEQEQSWQTLYQRILCRGNGADERLLSSLELLKRARKRREKKAWRATCKSGMRAAEEQVDIDSGDMPEAHSPSHKPARMPACLCYTQPASCLKEQWRGEARQSCEIWRLTRCATRRFYGRATAHGACSREQAPWRNHQAEKLLEGGTAGRRLTAIALP